MVTLVKPVKRELLPSQRRDSNAPRRTRWLSVSTIVTALTLTLASCATSEEARFVEFVKNSDGSSDFLNINDFGEWEEARLYCRDGRAGSDDEGNLDLGRLVLVSDGEIVLDYRPRTGDGVLFCPRLPGEEFVLTYPAGTLLVERPTDDDLAFGYGGGTLLYPPLD